MRLTSTPGQQKFDVVHVRLEQGHSNPADNSVKYLSREHLATSRSQIDPLGIYHLEALIKPIVAKND